MRKRGCNGGDFMVYLFCIRIGKDVEQIENSGIDLDVEAKQQEITTGKKIAAVVVTLFCFALVTVICMGIGGLLWHEGREVDISVETSGKQYTESVTFRIENILGMDLLLGEKEGRTAKLQKQNGEEWEDVCEIRFSAGNGGNVSAKYGGQFSYLAPGDALLYRLDGELLDRMESGTYRLAVYYISEEEYESYLLSLAERIEASLHADESEETGEPAEETGPEMSAEESETASEGPESAEGSDGGDDGSETCEETEEPDEPAVPEIRALYKVFTFRSKEDGIVEESETFAESVKEESEENEE